MRPPLARSTAPDSRPLAPHGRRVDPAGASRLPAARRRSPSDAPLGRLFLALALLAPTLGATESTVRGQAPAPPPNLATRTLGGMQFWTDEFVYRDWRIQRHCSTGHCRLLDDRNVRRAWGTREECRRKFDELRRSERLPDLKPRVVLLLHGLGHWRDVMEPLAERLRRDGDYETLLVSYASTRADLASHAEALARVVGALDEAREIDFVAHSLGNLVIRQYLADQTDAASGRRPDPRIRRIVMLGPPNQGARLAEQLGDLPLFPQIVGPSGRQLAEDWEAVSRRLATPACEFGILAGGRGDERGLNPLLAGDDDLIVRVEETRLAGARDFRVLPCLHRLLPSDPKAIEATCKFLQHGWFESEATRAPIVAGPPQSPPQSPSP